MTLEAQVKKAVKERNELYKIKNQLVETKQKTNEEVWEGKGRKDYDDLSNLIYSLSHKLPRLKLDRNQEREVYPRIGIIDLDTVEFISFVGDNVIRGEDSIDEYNKFIKKHPNYSYCFPYEGGVTYLFSRKPEIIPINDTIMLHRGACGIVKNSPKNILILLDLD
jgi:hypothetical protein